MQWAARLTGDAGDLDALVGVPQAMARARVVLDVAGEFWLEYAVDDELDALTAYLEAGSRLGELVAHARLVVSSSPLRVVLAGDFQSELGAGRLH